MIVLGVDPGLTGALAILDGDAMTIVDLPTQPIPGVGPKALVKREISPVELRTVMRSALPPERRDSALVLIESMHALGGTSVQTQASLAASKATVIAVAQLMGLRVERVAPQVWKRFYGLSANKRECIELAQKLFGRRDIRLGRHHNRAEAALIARYGRAHFA